MKKSINLITQSEDNNLRVDVFVNKKENTLSRTRIKNLILNEKLKLNNKIITSPSKKVLSGDKINLEIPEPKKASIRPYNFKLDIIYEDNESWGENDEWVYNWSSPKASPIWFTQADSISCSLKNEYFTWFTVYK